MGIDAFSPAPACFFLLSPTPPFLSKDFKQALSVSIEAKVLYGLLLDRMSLSVKNNWMDIKKRIYIYFTLENVMCMMDCGHNKAVRLFAELDSTGLIERVKQGQGRSTRVYVKNFILPPLPDPAPDPEKPRPPEDGQTSSFGKSAPAQEVLTSPKGPLDSVYMS